MKKKNTPLGIAEKRRCGDEDKWISVNKTAAE
jgi:hypothetical protein